MPTPTRKHVVISWVITRVDTSSMYNVTNSTIISLPHLSLHLSDQWKFVYSNKHGMKTMIELNNDNNKEGTNLRFVIIFLDFPYIN